MSIRNFSRSISGVILGSLILVAISSTGYTIPIGHISNGSGNTETHVTKLDFQGGLKSRFSATEIRPGEREVVAIAVGVCDAGQIVNTNVAILPSIVSGTPTIAGGLAAMPCIALAGGDGLHTGINGAVVTFSGPLAQFMGTVRMYADLDFDGTLFEGGDLVAQVVPTMQGTGEAVAQFGGRQGQFLSTSNGQPLVAPDVPSLIALGCPPGICPPNISMPRIILITVDISSTASGGRVEVALGLQVGDDTAQGAFGFCFTSLPVPPVARMNCGSNILGNGPETSFFNIVGSGGGSTGPGPGPGPSPTPTPTPTPGGSTLRSYDANSNCKLDDSEFFSLTDAWIAATVSNEVFFAGVDAWIGQSSICTAAAASVNAFRFDGATLRIRPELGAATFRAEGQGISAIAVEIFGLNGAKLYSAEGSGAQLSWNLRASNGEPLANGTYLYRVQARSASGEILQSQIKSFSLVR